MRHSHAKSHKGSVLILVIVALVALMGLAALAIDVSMLYAAKRRAQNVADASALAAGSLLPNTANASQVAAQIISANNAAGSAFNVTGITFATGSQSAITLDNGTTTNVGPNCAVTVSGYVNAPLSFAPVIGYQPTSRDGKANTQSVSASATIITGNVCAMPVGVGLTPFGVVADDPNSSDPSVAYIASLLTTAANSQTPLPNTYQPLSKQITLKASSWKNGTMQTGGNFGALALTGNGANSYRDAISNPTTQTFSVGDTISTKPGNMVGPTDQGIAARLDSGNTVFTHNYSDYVNWFFGDSTKPIDTSLPPVTEGSNTYYYHQDPHRQEITDAHVAILPLISQPSKNGRADAVILAFAAFFIESTGSGSVAGRFIGIMVPQSDSGSCAGAGSFISPRLIR